MSKFRRYKQEELAGVPWCAVVTVRWPDGTVTTEGLCESFGERCVRPLITMHGVACRPVVLAQYVELWERDILEACTPGLLPKKPSDSP